MSDDQREGADRIWEIARFEFVYFNPRHKRWQIWQEPPQAPVETPTQDNRVSPPLYRRQFQQLLRIVRRCFQSILEDSGRPIRFTLPSFVGEGVQFSIEQDRLLAQNPEFWKGFLDYCAHSLNAYGAQSPALEALLNDPSLANLCSNKNSHRIDHREALDLISILPILRDWDLFGCWYRAWSGRPRGTQGDWGFPPCEAGAGQWIEPFYVARLRYTNEPSPPGSPLERLIPTQTICTDLSGNANSIRIAFPEQDFFHTTYCTVSRSEDVLLYRAYAYLYDRLQQALTSSTSFIISYPVSCLSRIHFLQIQITCPGQPDVSIEDLWNDWMKQLHPLFWTPRVKQFLSEELQRISLSTFQAMWSTSLGRRLASGDEAEIRDSVLIQTFCADAYALVPLQSIRYGQKVWRYLPYNKRDAGIVSWGPGATESTSSQDADYGDLGAWWRESGETDPPDAHAAQDAVRVSWDDTERTSISLFLSSRYSNGLDRALDKGRARQIAEQQIEFGHQLKASMLEELRHLKEVQHEAKAATYAYFSNPRNRLDYLEGVTRDVAVPPALGSAYQPFDRITAIGWPDETQRYSQIERLSQLTIPLEVSDILEVGAVKALTHPGEACWSGALNEMIPYLRASMTKLPDLQAADGTETRRWKQLLPLFLGGCIDIASGGTVTTVDEAAAAIDLNYRTLFDDLRLEHFDETWELLFPEWQQEESPTTFRFRPCFPVWESIQLTRIRDEIARHTTKTPAVVGFAVPISPRPVSSADPWAHTSVWLFRNVLRCRYGLDLAEPNAWRRLVETRLWASIRGTEPTSGLARYGSLYLGRRNGDSIGLFDCTSFSGPVPVQLEDVFPCDERAYLRFMQDTFVCGHDEVIVALMFDTWRVK